MEPLQKLIRDYRKLYRDWAAGLLTEEQYQERLAALRQKHGTFAYIAPETKS